MSMVKRIDTMIDKLTTSDNMVLEDKHLACPYYETKCDDLECFCAKYHAYIDAKNENIVNDIIKELNITATDTWNIMFGIQKHFANRFHDVENVSKDTTDHWNKEYCICIEDEVEELLDYITLPLDDKPLLIDGEECKKEVIDILHFMMNVFISGNATADEVGKRYLQQYIPNVTAVDDVFAVAFNHAILENQAKYHISNTIKFYKNGISAADNEALLNATIKLLYVNREIRQQISWKHWKKPNTSINYNKLYDVYGTLFHQFMSLAALLFDSPNDIKEIYIKKNIENILRQKYNY